MGVKITDTTICCDATLDDEHLEYIKEVDYTSRYENVECFECGWTGSSAELIDDDCCPRCQCNGYIETIDEDEG